MSNPNRKQPYSPMPGDPGIKQREREYDGEPEQIVVHIVKAGSITAQAPKSRRNLSPLWSVRRDDAYPDNVEYNLPVSTLYRR